MHRLVETKKKITTTLSETNRSWNEERKKKRATHENERTQKKRKISTDGKSVSGVCVLVHITEYLQTDSVTNYTNDGGHITRYSYEHYNENKQKKKENIERKTTREH